MNGVTQLDRAFGNYRVQNVPEEMRVRLPPPRNSLDPPLDRPDLLGRRRQIDERFSDKAPALSLPAGRSLSTVMPRLDPGIHVFGTRQ